MASAGEGEGLLGHPRRQSRLPEDLPEGFLELGEGHDLHHLGTQSKELQYIYCINSIAQDHGQSEQYHVQCPFNVGG